jgi:hypothetical protein
LSTRLVTLAFDANDPLLLARFWAATLHWDIDDETDDEIGLVPTDGTRFEILFLPVPEPKTGKNRIHLDLVSESSDHQSEMVDRLIALGARHIDIWRPPICSVPSCSSRVPRPSAGSGVKQSVGRSCTTKTATPPFEHRMDTVLS